MVCTGCTPILSGLMLKRMDGPYEPSKRSDLWVKLKKDYIKGLQDTLDLVPIGAWFGNGRKVCLSVC